MPEILAFLGAAIQQLESKCPLLTFQPAMGQHEIEQLSILWAPDLGQFRVSYEGMGLTHCFLFSFYLQWEKE